MPTPVVATKLYVPPSRPQVVVRPRLMARLDDGLDRPLTLLSAPAGSGKTTLLSEWVAACARRQPHMPVAWLSLDEDDGDPQRFLVCLVAALQALDPSLSQGVASALQDLQPRSINVVLTALVNELAAFDRSFVLVLDDYHRVDSRSVDAALAFLLEHQPPGMHLVIASREDPALPLARLRARDQLLELRAAELRFTSAEAAEFLHRVMGLTLSERDVAALEARTEGWIVGLQLAALSMQGRDHATSFIEAFSGSHRFVVDYLVAEVIAQLPDDVRGFLLETCILDRLCAPLCDAVTGRDDAKEKLGTLERSNLFVIPLDDRRQWYRYHHLFAEVLLTHLHDAQPERVAALHRRASAWYESHGERADAIRHALAAGDLDRAAELIELALPAISFSREFSMLYGWLKQLPDDLVAARPVLSTGYALTAMACGEIEGVDRRLRDAERWLEASDDRPRSAAMVVVDEDEFRRLRGRVPLIRAGQALARGDVAATLAYARQARDNAAVDDRLTRGGAATQLGMATWAAGDLVTAVHLMVEGLTDLRLAGYIPPAIGGALTLADLQITLGRLRDARSTFERGLEWAALPEGRARQGGADMHVGLAALLYEHNDLDAAEQHLGMSRSLGELAALPQNPYRWRATMASICAARGDLDGAQAWLTEAERLYDGNFSPKVRPIAARRARLWLAQGRLNDAQRWVTAQQLSADDDLTYLKEYEHVTLARVLLTQGDSDHASLKAALALLDRLLIAAEAGGRQGSVIEILMVRALALHAAGEGPDAITSLQRALMLAEPEGYARLFIDEGARMASLLRVARAADVLPDYTGRLLAAFGVEASETAHLPDARLIEPLSARELEVLRLIASGLSNHQICERLFLALDTVKGHNRRIFEKLQVQRRTEAVARARELGLV